MENNIQYKNKKSIWNIIHLIQYILWIDCSFLLLPEFILNCWNFHFLSSILEIWHFMSDLAYLFCLCFDFLSFIGLCYELTLSFIASISSSVLKSHLTYFEGKVQICKLNFGWHLVHTFGKIKFERLLMLVCKYAPSFLVWLDQLFFYFWCWSTLFLGVFQDSYW